MKIQYKEMREKEGYKAVEIAKMLNITKNTYSQYENGKRAMPLETVEKLANIYMCPIDQLVGREWKAE